MSSAVIIVLREVLEAALIIGLLLACSKCLSISYRWLVYSLIIGLISAVILAYQLGSITDTFDGLGQELLNAMLLFLIVTQLMVVITAMALSHYQTEIPSNSNYIKLMKILFISIIICTVLREGSEIMIFISGFIHVQTLLIPSLLGSSIGAGIGISIGILIYYLTTSISVYRILYINSILAFIAAGLSIQILSSLMQAGILESDTPVWNSSFLVNENSIIGQLLYALIGYESTPALSQIILYATVLMTALLIVLSIKNTKK